jgi:hypothetical protein
MKDWPQPFWAVILASMGFILAVTVLYCPAEKDVKIAVLGLASSIVTGALGYIGGAIHAALGASKTDATFPSTK